MKTSKITKGILIVLMALLVCISCEKNELDPAFKGISRIVIGVASADGARADSILFSFATFGDDVQETDIRLIAQTMGNLSDAPRTFQLEADPVLTTAQPGEYEFPETVTIPPQGFRVTVPVKLMRTERLKETGTKLVLRVVPTSDFEPGPHVPGNLVNVGPSFNIVWNDQFTKPPGWDMPGITSMRLLGNWSRVKHQLVVELTGVRDFSALPTITKYWIQSVCLHYLASYNAANPGNPLRNEMGEIIGFCNTCN